MFSPCFICRGSCQLPLQGLSIKVDLTDLTVWRSFDVITFANWSLYCIEKERRRFFIDMRLDDEFCFALADQIHRILDSPQTSNLILTLAASEPSIS